MIDIYICEDNQKQREAVVRYVEAAILMEEYDMRLRIETGEPDKLIEQVMASENTGLYFLDIDLQAEQNGLMLAEKIREFDPRGFIVFITVHSEMSFLTFQYKVEAMDFILKDESAQVRQRICECMENANKRYMKITRGGGKTITINRGGRKHTLEYDEILFFETSVQEHKLAVHTVNKTMEFFGKIKEIEEEVGSDFIRCHRSYLVNRKNIKEVRYSDKLIIMKNQSSCPISFRLVGKVKKLLS